MNKDITYYQHLVEEFYLSHFAEIKKKEDKENDMLKEKMKEYSTSQADSSPHQETYFKEICVNTRNETCFFVRHYNFAVMPTELLFSCRMNNGKVESRLRDDGKDKVAEMLGLVDLYANNERVDVDYVYKDDGYPHLDLPERLQRYNKDDFYKMKLYGLDDFVSECNYTGWGDCFTNNVLEVIAGIMNKDFIDFEKKEIVHGLCAYVGPGDTDDTNYYAEFRFSHCEIARDGDSDNGWAVFFCYKYEGLEEYDE